MELEVNVVQTEMKGAPRFNLRCKVQAGREVHERSAVVHQPKTGAYVAHDQPKLSFAFASKPTEISLLFVALPNSKLHSPELGRGEDSLRTTLPGEQGPTRLILLGQRVPGTEIERFVGKLRYTAHFNIAAGTNLRSMFADEAARACSNVFPSECPTVSIVFHSAYTTVSQDWELVALARIGDRNDIRNDDLLQAGKHHPESLEHVSLLKPVRLSCQEFECLELHVADCKSDTILFSSSLALNRLAPFKTVHLKYDSSWTLGREDFSITQHGGSSNPSITVTLNHTPPLSESNQFVGLEVAICNIQLPHAVQQCRDVVMGVQLVRQDSKGKVPALSGSSTQPPFQQSSKKGQASSDVNYHVFVIRHHGKNCTDQYMVYLFFPGESFSSDNKSGMSLVFHIHGCRSEEVWWETDNYTSLHLDISEECLGQLQSKEIQYFPWEIKNETTSRSCNISGLLHWKSKQETFLSESTVREASDASLTFLPPSKSSRSNAQHVSSQPHALETRESLSPEPNHRAQDVSSLDLTSFERTLGGLLTPDEASVAASYMQGTHELSQLEQFEVTLQQMASDIRTLRQENQRLQAENEQLHLQMVQLKSAVAVSPQEQNTLQSLSASDLIIKIGALQQSLAVEERAHNRCLKKLQALQNDLSDRQSLKVQITQLQEAHTAQQKLVQLLRGKVDKYRKCSELCQKQEIIITQLESLLAKQAQGHPSAKDDAIGLLSRENAHLRAMLNLYQNTRDTDKQQMSLMKKDQMIQALKFQLSEVAGRCQQLEMEQLQDPKQENKQEFDTKIFELEQKLLATEAKLSALTFQLKESAEEWMSKEARYELQLAEYRSRLDAGIKSGQQVLESPQASNSATRQNSRDPQPHFSGKLNKKDFSF